MKNKKNIEHEIEETLNGFSDFKRYEGNPFLLTRINAGIDKKKDFPTYNLQSVFNYKSAFMMLILVLNIYTGVEYFKSQTESTYDRNNELISLMDEYVLSNDNYDINNEDYINE